MTKKIYIQAAEQISIQQPLSEAWMDECIKYDETFVHAVNPAFREYISGSEVRRMGNVMKRALVTTMVVLKKTGIENPDAIITGSCYGCLGQTEKFLDSMIENGEETLSPTYFMQSTHNTVSSALAIQTKTHGYNTTYSHKGFSFDLSVLDAWMQMQLGSISNALVGGHDEMIDSFHDLLVKTEFPEANGKVPYSEVSMAMMLNTKEDTGNLCELSQLKIVNSSSIDNVKRAIIQLLEKADMTAEDVNAVMSGKNGNIENDRFYNDIETDIFPDTAHLQYKNVFGENYSASCMGMYAAAHCLKRGTIPACLYDNAYKCNNLRNILLINHINGRQFSITLLKTI